MGVEYAPVIANRRSVRFCMSKVSIVTFNLLNKPSRWKNGDTSSLLSWPKFSRT